MNAENVTYFDSFGVEHVPKEIKKFIGNINIIANIYRIQAHGSIISEYFCIEFIDFMLKGKSLLDYAKLFSPNEYEKMIKFSVIKKLFLCIDFKKVRMRKVVLSVKGI